MRLVEQHVVKKGNCMYAELDSICFKAKNLYNAALYDVRQAYFETQKFKNYCAVNNTFVQSRQSDYYALPTKVSQQTLKLVEQNFKSFFSLCKLKANNQYKEKVKIPKYLHKTKGRAVAIYTNQAISSKSLKEGIVKLSGTNICIHTDKTNIQQVRIVPRCNCIVIEIVYTVEEPELLEDNEKYAGIDLGINNLATVGGNNIRPYIINGRPVKSINQFYNKQIARLKSKLKGNQKTSKRIRSITNKRNNRIKDYLHKSSRHITNQLAANRICKVAIGLNKSWKQDVNLGKKTNQAFVQIPHSQFIQMLEYKCRLKGITVVVNEESYTSKCSFLDNEKICKHSEYKGKRVKRGLFRSSSGKFINADQNACLNILRKVVGDFEYDPIEVCSTPVKLAF